ncbi:hypothetical protein BDR05DRAFT_680843 [Suillus weaverae]|nr:hypothetical protein BDR05DRAFT_680843 [Suillus weaverae]
MRDLVEGLLCIMDPSSSTLQPRTIGKGILTAYRFIVPFTYTQLGTADKRLQQLVKLQRLEIQHTRDPQRKNISNGVTYLIHKVYPWVLRGRGDLAGGSPRDGISL